MLRAVVETASAQHGTAVVLTFDPHPLTVLKPHIELRFLSSVQEKRARFEEIGINEVISLEFTQALASLSPKEFVMQVLRDALGVKDLLVGEAFAFGRERAGAIGDLLEWGPGAGFRVHPIPAVRVDGEVVSSSRIRRLILDGEVQTASKYLGRRYMLSGSVVRGEQRGRSLGWPTANLHPPRDRVIPADGVYAAKAVCEGQRYDAAVYIGTRPTFGGVERLLEVYLLDEARDLYGQDLAVEFVQRLRGDMVFSTPEELSVRIDRDVALARESLKDVPLHR